LTFPKKLRSWSQIKNLLILTSRYPHKHDSISASFVYNQINELKDRFERIVIIATTPFVPKILTTWMQPIRKKDALVENYTYDNIEVYFTKNWILPFNLLKKYKGIQGYKSSKKILDKIDFKPDIIHSHFSWPSGYIGTKLKEELDVPCIVTIHENHDWLLEEKNNKEIRKIWKSADALIRVNKLDAQMLKAFNTKTYSIPNGYNHRKFSYLNKEQSRKKLGLPLNKFITFSLGHLNERKGFQILIESISKLPLSNRQDLLTIIGGNGPQKQQLNHSIKKNNLEDNIKLIGFIDDDRLSLWLHASDVFILPSYSEGNPTVMFEALGCGRPFIGTKVGGIPEIIDEDKLGFTISPGDSDALSSIILDSIDIKWNESYIRENSKQYTWKNISNQIFKIYKMVYSEKL